MTDQRKMGRKDVAILLLAVCALSLFSVYYVSAAPQGATIVGTPTVDTGPTRSPGSATHPGGRIITMTLTLEQQNNGWKAYVGNATGTYVLQNAVNQSIYEWALSTVGGEVYISRGATVNFSAVVCANTTTMTAENTFFGFVGSDADSINKTFNATAHSAINIGSTTIGANTCPSTALWINDTIQQQSSSATFQEIVLSDGSNLVYTSILNNDKPGFSNATYDFQAIIPDNRSSATGAAYYFYLELG
jgi:hypothetical protein